MKKTIFCYEKVKGNDTYFFNTLSRTLVKSKTDDSQTLAEYGFYVDDDFDEYKQFLFDYYRQCYNTKFFSITYLMTNMCNFRCTYCFETNAYKSQKEKILINPNDFVNICKYIVNREHIKYLDINFFGGEPLLKYEDILFIVSQIKDIDVKSSFNIVTNGYLLDSEKVREMKECGIDSLQITIDGCKENHDACRVLANGGPTYDIILHNALLAIDAGIEVIINITYSNDNYESIDLFLRDFPPEYRNRVYIKFTKLLDLTKTNTEVLGRLYSSLKKYGFPMQDISHLEYGPCMNKLRNSLLVHADGKLSKCIFDVSDYALGYSEFNNDYSNVEKMLIAKSIHTHNLNSKCKQCPFLPMCKGGCDRLQNHGNDICRKDYFQSVANAIIDYLGDE